MKNKYDLLVVSSLKFFTLVLLLSLILVACSDNNEGGDWDENTKFQPVQATVMVDPVVLRNFSTQAASCFDNLGALTAAAYLFEDQETDVDDIDGISPDPISVVSVIEQTPDKYYYQAEFAQPGKYRGGITCEPDADDPLMDDDINFFAFVYIRIGDIKDIAGVAELPEGHWSATTDCEQCHSLGEGFDVMDMNHSFVIGACMDCHDSPELL